MKETLKKATVEEERKLVEEVNDKILSNKLGKPEVRHAAEAIINNKKPQIDGTTRETYKEFCSNLKAVAQNKGNGPLLQKVKKFEERYLS